MGPAAKPHRGADGPAAIRGEDLPQYACARVTPCESFGVVPRPVLGDSGWRPLLIAGMAKPELPDRLGGVDLSGRTTEEEAQHQPEMPAGPGVTGTA